MGEFHIPIYFRVVPIQVHPDESGGRGNILEDKGGQAIRQTNMDGFDLVGRTDTKRQIVLENFFGMDLSCSKKRKGMEPDLNERIRAKLNG